MDSQLIAGACKKRFIVIALGVLAGFGRREAEYENRPDIYMSCCNLRDSSSTLSPSLLVGSMHERWAANKKRPFWPRRAASEFKSSSHGKLELQS
jgi:hypothetical protein